MKIYIESTVFILTFGTHFRIEQFFPLFLAVPHFVRTLPDMFTPVRVLTNSISGKSVLLTILCCARWLVFLYFAIINDIIIVRDMSRRILPSHFTSSPISFSLPSHTISIFNWSTNYHYQTRQFGNTHFNNCRLQSIHSSLHQSPSIVLSSSNYDHLAYLSLNICSANLLTSHVIDFTLKSESHHGIDKR